MATVMLPRSLLALFPGVERKIELDADSVDAVITALDGRAPGIRDRLVDFTGPRLRAHINVFVDGRPADLTTPVEADATVHVIPAVSGGSASPLR